MSFKHNSGETGYTSRRLRRSKIIHHAQEEAAKIILEQLKPYEKVTKTLIKVLLVKNEFTKSMADLVYERYQESTK